MRHKWKISRNIEFCEHCGSKKDEPWLDPECERAKYGHRFVPRLKDGEWQLYCAKCGEKLDKFLWLTGECMG